MDFWLSLKDSIGEEEEEEVKEDLDRLTSLANSSHRSTDDLLQSLPVACQLNEFLFLNRKVITHAASEGKWGFSNARFTHSCFLYALIDWANILVNQMGMELNGIFRFTDEETKRISIAKDFDCSLLIEKVKRVHITIGICRYVLDNLTSQRNKWASSVMKPEVTNIQKQMEGLRYICVWMRIGIIYGSASKKKQDIEDGMEACATCLDLIKGKDKIATLIGTDCEMMFFVLRCDWHAIQNDNVHALHFLKKAVDTKYGWIPTEDQTIVRRIAEAYIAAGTALPVEHDRIHSHMSKVNPKLSRLGIDPLTKLHICQLKLKQEA